jgi:hypothetical protein
MNKISEDERTRWKVDEMDQEQLDANWKKARIEMARLTPEEMDKYVEKGRYAHVRIAPRPLAFREEGCDSCRIDCSVLPRCPLPILTGPVYVISIYCSHRHDCDERTKIGCPSRCPYFILTEFEERIGQSLKFGLVELLVAEGIDLRTWRDDEDFFTPIFEDAYPRDDGEDKPDWDQGAQTSKDDAPKFELPSSRKEE